MPASVLTTALTKRCGSRVAVVSVDIERPTGAVAGFVGPNGSGQTTTIQLLPGLIRPSSGSVQATRPPTWHAFVTLAVYVVILSVATQALFACRDA